MKQPGFFGLYNRHIKLNEKDPLIHLDNLIDWDDFRPILDKARPEGKRKTGRPPFDLLLMFKILILQGLYNVSDDKIEDQIRNRYSFCRFLGFNTSDRFKRQ